MLTLVWTITLLEKSLAANSKAGHVISAFGSGLAAGNTGNTDTTMAKTFGQLCHMS